MLRQGQPITSFKVGDVITGLKAVKVIGNHITMSNIHRRPFIFEGVEVNMIFLRPVKTITMPMSNPIPSSSVSTEGILTLPLEDYKDNWTLYRLPDRMLKLLTTF